MARANEKEMRRLASTVERFAVQGARRTIRLIHTGTVRPFGRSPGAPKATGETRSGGRVGLNSPPTFIPPAEAAFYPIMGSHEIDRATAGMRLGDTIHWRNRVPYAFSLELGRRFSAKLGRMVGSEQAPKGFLKLAIVEAREQMLTWRYKAA